MKHGFMVQQAGRWQSLQATGDREGSMSSRAVHGQQTHDSVPHHRQCCLTHSSILRDK